MLTNLELKKQIQMQENERIHRQLIELEHDKFVNLKVIEELEAENQQEVERLREEQSKYKAAWLAQQQIKRESEQIENLF